ncbi:Cytosine deaminase [bioreactor metagenome]|uniref:Cytosine deaminase n=1 Tax=bioreactor metagenome TaxID=1076179 RepID=A0A645JGS3_9ZZZZ
MGRNDAQPVRRGITTIREFMAAGVNVAIASDNVRDPFRPYGNGNMLEECLLTAQLIQASRIQEFNDVYRMGTYNAAKAMLLDGYGIEKGCSADLVIFDTPDLQETLLSQGTKRIVKFGGRVVSRTEKNAASCIDATK